MAQPGMWIVITLLFFVVSVFAQFVPFLGPIALALLTPALLAGTLFCAHEADTNRNIEAGFLFQVFQQKAKLNPMLTLGGMYLLGQFVIAILMVIVMFAVAGPTFWQMMQNKPVEPIDPQMIGTLLVAMLVFLVLLTVLMMLFVYAIPLVMFTDTDPFTAMKSSLLACWRNMWPLFFASVLYTLLAFIAMIPFFLGLLVLAPVSFAAWYASFCDIYPDHESEEGILHV
jgi:uncharacterized membrane protein